MNSDFYFEILLQMFLKKKHPLAPVTIRLPASSNETVIANVVRAICQTAYFPGIVSSGPQNSSRRKVLLLSPLSGYNSETQPGKVTFVRSHS